MLKFFSRPPRGPLLSLFEFSRRRFKRPAPSYREVEALGLNPEAPWGKVVDAGTALLEAARFEDADIVFESGLFHFPEDPTLRIRHALSANNSGRYRIAIMRWEAALRVAPDKPICRIGLAANHREIGDLMTAWRWITGAMQLWPQDEGVVSEAARIAERSGRIAEALDLWGSLITGRDPHPDFLRGHAYCLVLLGRFEEATAAITAALQLYPQDHRLLAVEAMLASAQQDWQKAIALWSAYRQRFPTDRTGWEHYDRAVQASQHRSASPNPVAADLHAPSKIDGHEDSQTRELLLAFESIGDNCEFGSVQCRYGADPIGLLRWNDLTFDGLTAALNGEFEGMGEAEHTEMSIVENGEFVLRDRRWGLWMHTFLFRGQVDHDALYPKMCQRVAYLRDKLVADLIASEKTFVFRSKGLTEDQIETLHRALWFYGPIRLLNVQPADAPTGLQGAPGQVVEIEERRYVGFLRKLGVAEGNNWDIAYDDWLSICRTVAV